MQFLKAAMIAGALVLLPACASVPPGPGSVAVIAGYPPYPGYYGPSAMTPYRGPGFYGPPYYGPPAYYGPSVGFGVYRGRSGRFRRNR